MLVDGSRPNSTEDGRDAALRELAARLLAPLDVHGVEDRTPPRLYVGRLPEELSVWITIPEGATVVGSAVHGLPRARTLYEIVLDAETPAEHLREVYQRRLLAAGWTEEDDYPPRRGFVPRGIPLFFRLAYRFPCLRRRLRLDHPGIPPLFRLGARDPKLWFVARDRQDSPTDVRLTLAVRHRDPWVHHDLAWAVIPRLSSPPDVLERYEPHATNVLHPPPDVAGRPRGGGGPYEPDGAYSYATLETGLDLTSLTAHYAGQLEDAGWTRAYEGQSGPQA